MFPHIQISDKSPTHCAVMFPTVPLCFRFFEQFGGNITAQVVYNLVRSKALNFDPLMTILLRNDMFLIYKSREVSIY